MYNIHFKILLPIFPPPASPRPPDVETMECDDPAAATVVEANPLLPMRASRSLTRQLIQCLGGNLWKLLQCHSQAELDSLSEEKRSYLDAYLSAMTSLIIGMSKSNLDELFSNQEVDSSNPEMPFVQVVSDGDNDLWLRHAEISEESVRELLSFYLPSSPDEGFSKPFSLGKSAESLLMETLHKRKVLHIFTAFGIVTYLNILSNTQSFSKLSRTFLKFSSKIIAGLAIHLCCMDEERPEKINMFHTMKQSLLTCLKAQKQLINHVWDILDSEDTKFASSKIVAKELLLSDQEIKQVIEN